MQFFNKWLTFIDTNHWFATIGSQINTFITRNGHFISEDITFIESIISSQNDLPFNYSNETTLKSIYDNNKIKICTKCLITIGIIWYLFKEISYHFLISTIIGSLLLTCLPMSFDIIRKIYFRHKLINKTLVLSEKLMRERDLLKRYLKLIEDNEVIEESERHSTRVRDMKHSFRTICWKCFVRIRQSTQQLRQTFPLKPEIDEEMNFLCCLPMESFDRFQTEDQSVISINLLKSLKQLTRLQESEFFRRLICLFMTICSQNRLNKSDDYMHYIYEEVFKIINVLILETDETISQLYSTYSCGRSLWICSQSSVINISQRSEKKSRSETLNLININRSIRKHLLTTLAIVEDCDALIEDDIEINSIRCELREKLETIGKEFKNLNDLVLNMEKLLKVGELKRNNFHESSFLDNTSEDSVKPSINSSNIDNYIVEDQVFEAYVERDYDENQLSCDSDDNEMWEYRLKLAQEKETSSNLYRELKVALKSKAVEHKIREAKALGIHVNDINEEDINDINEEDVNVLNDENKVLDNKQQLCDITNVIPMNENNSKQSNSIASDIEAKKDQLMANNMLNFTQIANIAAQRGKMFGLSHPSECFGDDIDDSHDSDGSHS